MFVVNPTGVRRLELLQHRCREEAQARGWHPRFVVTTADDRSRRLHEELSGYIGQDRARGLVFAVGGDGTVSACAHDLAGSEASLAIVPRGTANLFARALGVPSELQAALRTGFEGRDRVVDMAFVDGESPCVAMAGIGTDAAVVNSVPQHMKQDLGWLGYALAALPHLARAPTDVTVRLDGGEPRSYRAQGVVVGNVGILPGGFTIFPGARLDDGLLEVGIFEVGGPIGWAAVARQVISGRGTRRRLSLHRAALVEVVTGPVMPRQVDGEGISPSTSMSVRVSPRSLKVRTGGDRLLDRHLAP